MFDPRSTRIRVVGVHVQPGERVEVGDRLVTLEVMKMETAVDAPLSGVVTSVSVDVASRVAAATRTRTTTRTGAAASASSRETALWGGASGGRQG